MKRWLVVVVMVIGCGGDDDSSARDDAAVADPDARPVDASIDVRDGDPAADAEPGGDSGPVGACNPITQAGCAAGQKCTWLTVQEEPFLGRTDCVPDGDVEIGGACVEGPPGETTGYDDCAAGGLCVNDLCRAICSIEPESCGEGFACSAYTNTFSDDAAGNTGVCDPTCDPVAQTCEEPSDGCYLQLFNGHATCAAVAAGAEDITQGETCLNDGVRCYLNGCARGFGGFLYTGGSVRACTAFCTPVDTYLVDPDGDGAGSLVAGADANGAAPYDCSEARIGVLGHQCRFFQSHFIDQNNAYLDYIPAAYGFCAPRGDTYGNCRIFSEEWFLETYSDFIEGGGTPGEWGPYITEQCAASQRCASGCAELATLDALDAAYCAVPANTTRPACIDGLVGARIVRRSLLRLWAEQWIRDRAVTGSR